MILFFDALISPKTENFTFNNEESKHLVKVLRKKIGDSVTITNGKGLEWCGVLNHIGLRKSSVVRVRVQTHQPPEKQIHIAISPTKNNSRFEWFLEKATEIGVSSVTPLLCEYSERKAIKLERFQKIMINALKQSQQFFLPILYPMTDFDQFINKNTENVFLAHCYKFKRDELTSFSFDRSKTLIMIGPEGDFSEQEIEKAFSSGVTLVSLGKNRLRTETAGLVALCAVSLKQNP